MEFSFKDMLGIIKKNIILVLVVAIIAGAGAYLATSLLIEPTYNSTVKLYVNTQNNAKTSYDELNSHNYAQKMVATYIEVLNSNHFYSKVAKELPDKYSASYLKKNVTFSEVDDTEVFTATVTCNDPIDAKTIADAVAKVAPQTIKEQFENNASLKIVDEAQLPKAPTSPNPMRNAIIAFVAGILITLIIVFAKDYFDVKIKYDSEMTVLCGLPVLAAIPEFANNQKSEADKAQNNEKGVR
ncbi:MAG TPA: hypothetical protein DEO32_05705 [Ruminococcaceae bacterium]|nr:hypothetical protein [Oscillospiraceae bacterium]